VRRALQLRSEVEGGDRVVVASGEIDMESSPRLLAEIQRAFGRGGRLVVDLSAVDYIDSSGIAVLIQGLKGCKQRAQEFVLRRPSARVLAVIELADLQRLFRIEADPGAPR
jgi:anti-sigma B factor antagonist